MHPKIDKTDFRTYLLEYSNDAIDSDVYKALAFYLSFMIFDFYGSPKTYPTLWTIRIIVVSICTFLAIFNKHPLIHQNRRLFYIFSIMLVMNSTVLIWSIRYPDTLPANTGLPAAILVCSMVIFRMLAIDALIIGFIYCLSFCILLISRESANHVWQNYALGLGVAYALGGIGAIVSEKNLYRSYKAEKLLRRETERADNLLIKTFPLEVAKELKDHQKSQARRFDNVSVMFCDIVNFTEASSNMPPEELVECLNGFFSAFDHLTEQHGCEKIKTIGDAYMAVCGAPTPRDDHAQRIVGLAMAIKAVAKDFYLNGSPLTLRIGINTGPIVAGVIGKNRFAYDLWGDTVNIASRMEALCKPGQILLTESTKSHLDDAFRLQKITALSVKGKGKMDAWQLVGYNAVTQSTSELVA